jgi:hypothetical protein
MNTHLAQQINIVKNSNSTQSNNAILHAVIALARTCAISKKCPSQYAKYGYDFSEMIKVKVVKLRELNRNDQWINALYNLLINSLESPEEIVSICMEYLRETGQDNKSYLNRKEHINACT